MQISTKFDIDQTVWLMHDNKPQSVLVTGLRIVVSPNKDVFVYYDTGGMPGEHPEHLLFPSKAALLESL